MTTKLREALDYLNGARFANYSGQIVEQRDGRDRYILFDLSCSCSEVGSKISDEYGEALVTLLNSARLVDEVETLARDLLARLSRDYGDTEGEPDSDIASLFERGERLLPIIVDEEAIQRVHDLFLDKLAREEPDHPWLKHRRA